MGQLRKRVTSRVPNAVKPDERRTRAPVCQVMWCTPCGSSSCWCATPLAVSSSRTSLRTLSAARTQVLCVVLAPYLRLASWNSHHECHGLRERVFVRFTAQHLGHHLRAPVWHPAREWELLVGRDSQSAARPAAGPDEAGAEAHTSASEWVGLAVCHVR